MKKLSIFLLALVFGFMMPDMVGCSSDTSKVKQTINVDTITIQQKDTFTLNQKNLFYMIDGVGIKHPKIVLKQAILETGHFTSNYCIKYHNLFGFMTNNGCKKFDSYEDCILYYKRWQDLYYVEYKYNTYYDFLEDIGYAEDTTYVDNLVKIKIDV